MLGFSSDNDMTDDEANMVLIYLGVMFGESNSLTALNLMAKHFSGVALKKLPKIALTKRVVYPLFKNISKILGVKVTKDTFAKNISKVILVLGGFVSGGITFATLKIMSNKLYKYLA